ncbi:hypothetical protein DIPPA_09189 [Diplonema papillatum]|nr:hypothetical protein DIPPA_09189 [Diplonema papillatum]
MKMTIPELPKQGAMAAPSAAAATSSFRHNPYSTQCTYEKLVPQSSASLSSTKSPSALSAEYWDSVPLLSSGRLFSDLKPAPSVSSSTCQSQINTPVDTPPPSPPATKDVPLTVPVPHPALRHSARKRSQASSTATQTSELASPRDQHSANAAGAGAAGAACSSGGAAAAAPPPAAAGLGYELMVRFRTGRMSFFLHTHTIRYSTYVIVEGDRGLDLGMVVCSKPLAERPAPGTKTAKVRRLASAKEIKAWKENFAEDEAAALQYMRALATRHNLPITVQEAEYQFDRKKVTFHYTTAADHPDFRPLLKAAYRQFRCRIWFNNCDPQGDSPGEPLPHYQTNPAVPLL